MSSPTPASHEPATQSTDPVETVVTGWSGYQRAHAAQSADPVETVVPLIPIVLPLVGGVLMFLLAFIAVFMA